MADEAGQFEARYIYSVARTDLKENLGDIGIGKETVYTIPHRGIAALVHSCWPLAYNTKDKALAEEWIIEHSYVIDQATKRFGAVLPFSFDVIIKGDDAVIEQWLIRNYKHLLGALESVEGSAEYTIQIYYDHDDLSARVLESDAELNALKGQIEKESKGKAYFLQKKLDQKLKSRVSSQAENLAAKYLLKIKSLVKELKAEGNKWMPEDYKRLKLLASYSCLVSDDRVAELGEILEEIDRMQGFKVRFTGPWAPFSFASIQELA
ncbi:Gas vesicle synthesis protein GvpL/GvpF [uncultured archaeon]|nr:Gas vesicle synthesis protein GvpL/GvpF [uncultured archaeon]